MPTYQGIHGSYTIIEPCRASGGEGEIFDIRGRKDLVLKRLADRHRTTTREKKLEAMMRAGVPRHLLSQLTWPVDLAYENGRFIGYVMPALHKAADLNEVYSPQSSLTLSDRITVAMNLCVPVDGLHQLGQYVGDGNPENICVDPAALTVTFVDTDSYTIRDRVSGRIYPCEVGLDKYLAPEVQKALKQHHSIPNLPPDTFNEYTDRFWLAVHIFALLMNGTHPFAVSRGSQVSMTHMSVRQKSVSLPQPDGNICSGFFPHTMKRAGLEIPKYCPKFSYLPTPVQNLFIRAFVDGYTDPSARPSAREWFAELGRLQQSLVSGTHCHNRKHQYPSSAAFCPWCELAARAVPKPPVHGNGAGRTGNGGFGNGGTTGGYGTGAGSGGLGGGTGNYNGGAGGRARRGPKLGCLPGCLMVLLMLAVIIGVPTACTANMIESGRSGQLSQEEAMQEKLEELRQEADQNQQSAQSGGPASYDSGMQADGTWVHPHDSRVLQVPATGYQDLRGSVSDAAAENLYDLYPAVNGTYWLETIDSDQHLWIRVYDDTGYCLASYISEENGHGTSMELTGGQHYTVKVERRFADTGNYHLRWWQQKEMKDLNGYGSLSDSIEFNQQVNVYQFRCAATKNYQVLCTQSAADLGLSIQVYDESGNRLNSAINVGQGFGPTVTLECGKTYCIYVNAYTGSGSYSLDVQMLN